MRRLINEALETMRNLHEIDVVGKQTLRGLIGRIFWESSRAPGRNRPNVIVSPSGVKLSWDY